MPARIEPILKDNYYHIYNRGVNKGQIFFSNRNYQFFQFKMVHYFNNEAKILAYCLMPNHFHLLVRVESDDFVQSALQPFFVTYTKSVNSEQNRVGPLFQGRFQANLIGNAEYLLDCVKYIHLNPVKAKLVQTPVQWEYSSYRDYLHKNDHSFEETEIIMQYFGDITEFVSFSEFGVEEYEPKFLRNGIGQTPHYARRERS